MSAPALKDRKIGDKAMGGKDTFHSFPGQEEPLMLTEAARGGEKQGGGKGETQESSPSVPTSHKRGQAAGGCGGQ